MDWLIEVATELELDDVSTAVALIDILIRSSVLYVLACFINEKLATHATSNARYRFLAAILLLIGLSPALPSLLGIVFGQTTSFAFVVLLFADNSANSSGSESQAFMFNSVLTTGYCLGALFCLSRLLVALIGLRELRASADFHIEEEDQALLKRVQSEINLHLKIGLAKSSRLQSPVTFGVAHPLVLIPREWDSWSKAEKLAVLRHELAHIKRWDWPINILIGVLVSLNWFNPFIWLLRNKVHNESEYDCDATVLNLGSSKYAYAGQLLTLARTSKSKPQLIQGTASMIEVGELTDRLDAILNYQTRQADSTSWFIKSFLVATLAFASSISFAKAISVENTVLFRDAQLTHTEQPIYNSPNIFNGLEARTRLRFDVDEQGRVIAESIEVLRSSSPDVMVLPVIEALKRFRFEPRIEHGQPVIAADMEYEFTVGGYESSFSRQ